MLPRAVRVRGFAGVAFPLVLTLAFALGSAAGGARASAQEPKPSDSQRVQPDTTAPPSPMTFAEKVSLYQSRTFSIRAVLRASYAAGIAQWRGTPREWGAGISGYGRRDAAAYGGGIIHHTVEFGVGSLLHEDPRFERSTRNGFSARTIDALHSTIFVRTDDGGRRFAWSRVAAAVVTGFSVNSWEPRRLHSTHHAVALSLAGLLGYGTGQFTQEFTPDVKRFLFRGTPLEGRF